MLEDDEEWSLLFQKLLKHNGYETTCFPTAGRFFDALIKVKPEVAIIDMQLPGMHGREVIRVLRQNPESRGLLIIAVSAHDISSGDAVKALDVGADEYLAKPVNQDLLLARISALLRRSGGAGPLRETLSIGPLVVVPEERTVHLGSKEIQLTNLEFNLLVAFLRQPNRVLTRGLILQTVWGTIPDMATRTVDKHVESLRRKLGVFGKNLETVVRVGYVLKI